VIYCVTDYICRASSHVASVVLPDASQKTQRSSSKVPVRLVVP